MFLRIQCVFLAIFMAQALSAEPKLDLEAGSLFAIGGMGLDYRIDDLTKNEHRINILSDVGAGYFIRDYLAVGLTIPIEWQVLGKQAYFGLKPFSTYYFDVGSIFYPYVGGNLSFGYSSFGQGEFKLKAGIDSGILLTMTKNLGFDFGIRPEISFKLSRSQNWALRIPMGFLGIVALF